MRRVVFSRKAFVCPACHTVHIERVAEEPITVTCRGCDKQMTLSRTHDGHCKVVIDEEKQDAQ